MSPVISYNPGRCTAVCPVLIEADGTFRRGPAKWTASRTGTGVYEIVHNAGHTEYLAIPGTITGPGIYRQSAGILEMTDTKIVVQCSDSTQPVDGNVAILVVML